MDEKEILREENEDDEMHITYTKVGDYYYPDLIPNKVPEEPLTKYGLLRRDWIDEQDESATMIWAMNGTLHERCLKVQNEAIEREEELVKQMAQNENVTEKLKRRDQLEWVRRMNNIRSRVEEIVLDEIVYGRPLKYF